MDNSIFIIVLIIPKERSDCGNLLFLAIASLRANVVSVAIYTQTHFTPRYCHFIA